MKTAAKDFKMTELGPIPKDWEVKRLGELVEVYDGTHQTPTYVECGYPFYSVENITSNDFVNVKRISEAEHKRLTKSHRIEKGDVLMTRIGSIGDCKYVDWDVQASYYVSLALLKQRGSPGIDMRYLALASESELFKKNILLNSLQFAIPQKINLGKISDVLVLYPPLPEQRKISAALSDVDEMIVALEKLIEKKRKIKTGAMQRLLTGKTRLPGFKGAWVEKCLGELGYGVRGVGYKPWQSGTTPMVGRVQLLRSNNVQDGRLNFNDVVYVDECCVSDGQRMRVGDILICAANGSRNLVGKAAPLLVEREVTFGAFMSVFRCHDNNQAAFVGHLLNSGTYKQKLDDILTGSAINNLNVSDIEDMRFFVPPALAEQKAIAKVLGDMDEEIAELEAELAKTRQLKQGMMQELLTGKTRLSRAVTPVVE